MFNYFAVSLTLFCTIVSTTSSSMAMASSNEQICRNTVKQQLEKTDFNSAVANKLRPTIISAALPDAMDVIKRSNRGELNSFADRQDLIKDKLERKFFLKLIDDMDAVSYQAADRIEPLLENECQGVI